MSPRRIYISKRYLDTVIYAIGILLFALPFVAIKSKPIEFGGFHLEGKAASITGFDMVKSISKSSNNNPLLKPDTQTTESVSSILGLLVVVFAGLAFIFSIVRFRNRAMITTILGLLSFLGMVGLFINIQSSINKTMHDETGFIKQLGLQIGFTPWFYISAVVLAIATFITFRIGQEEYSGMPPNAPQVRVNNPGEQSDFPSAASESELG